MKKLKNLKKWVSDYNLIKDSLEEFEVLIEFEKSINNFNYLLSTKLHEVVNFLESNNTELNIYSKVDFFNKIKPYNLFKKI